MTRTAKRIAGRWLGILFFLATCHGAAALAGDGHRTTPHALAQSQYETAMRYEEGIGSAPNPAKAMQWYARAASKGHAAAQNNLGALYFVQGSYQQALYWYRRAAHHGNANAQFNLGLVYELGRVLPPDRAKAQYWYKLAAAQGHWDAQYNLARLNDDDLPPLPSSP